MFLSGLFLFIKSMHIVTSACLTCLNAIKVVHMTVFCGLKVFGFCMRHNSAVAAQSW